MSTNDPATGIRSVALRERYSRAVRRLGPKIAAGTPGLVLEGHWLDETHFYFLAERFEPSIGRVVATPVVVDAGTRRMEDAISLDALAELLCGHSGGTIDLEMLSCAAFDMRDRGTLAITVGGRDHIVDLRQRRVLDAQPSFDLPALHSPDGRHACFVRGHDLWLKDRQTGADRALTHDGTLHNCYGQQPDSCLSALTYRRCPAPVGLWSPDSRWFLTHRIDERSLPDLALIENTPPGGGRPAVHRFKYPMPGDPMPIAIYVAIHVASGRTIEFGAVPATTWAVSPFSQRRIWFDGTQTAWFVRFDRYCRQADLVRLDLVEERSRVVLSETVETGYIDLNPFIPGPPNVRTLRASKEVIWYSERDGWAHLYLYDLAGNCKNQITRGRWQVRTIVHVDEIRRRVLFLAGGIDPQADPARRSLCAVNFDGSGFEIVLSHDGDVFMPATEPTGLDASPGRSPDGRFGVVRYMSVDKGNWTEIVDLEARRGFAIASVLPEPGEVLPRPFTAMAADGATRLHGVMFLPADFDERRHYPLIDYIYPGPQVAQQPQSFRAMQSAMASALAELGFVTMMLDTRSTPFGSRAFRHAGYGRLLEPQLADHAAVVQQLSARFPFVDGDRVGIFGYSGGGSAAARALLDYGDVFKVGVAACGNHDNRFNIACWADKYCGPADRVDWAREANASVAHELEGKLLLISGDMDENVHVSHTLGLADALIRANKDFDLLIVPNAGHEVLFGGYAQRRMWDYFVKHLLAEEPPADVEIGFAPHEWARFWKIASRERL